MSLVLHAASCAPDLTLGAARCTCVGVSVPAFDGTLEETDPEVAQLIRSEKKRQVGVAYEGGGGRQVCSGVGWGEGSSNNNTR